MEVPIQRVVQPYTAQTSANDPTPTQTQTHTPSASPQQLAHCLNTGEPIDVLKMLGNNPHLDLAGQTLNAHGFANLVAVIRGENIQPGSITKLTLKGTRLPRLTELLQAMMVNVSITELNLSGLRLRGMRDGLPGIASDHCRHIANILGFNRSVQILDLSGLRISDCNEFQGVLDQLKGNSSLQELRLNNNNLCKMDSFSEMLKTNSTLRCLNLAENLIGANISSLMGALTENFTLEELNLRKTGLPGESLENIQKGLAAQQAERKAMDERGIQMGDRGIQRLDLGENYSDQSYANVVRLRRFIDSLATNSSLTHLDLASEDIKRDSKYNAFVDFAVEKTCEKNYTLIWISPYGKSSHLCLYSNHRENIKSFLQRNQMLLNKTAL